MEHPSPNNAVEKFACLICRQRKIKCDRLRPCTTCAKTGQQCDYIPPVRGKRKRTVTPREGLHAKLQRYEELLKSRNTELDPVAIGNSVKSPSVSTSRSEVVERRNEAVSPVIDRQDTYRLEQSKPIFIAKKGVSRYLDSALWSGVRHEFAFEEMNGPIDSINQLPMEENDILFKACENQGLLPHDSSTEQEFAKLLPAVESLAKIQEIYTDRVDPFIKILHLPSFWAWLRRSVENPLTLTKSMEAVILAFLLTTVNTMDEDECSQLMGSQKSTLSPRYRLAARQALVNARFLTTTDPRALQALTMFIMGVWTIYQRDTLFILSGTAIRIARKMGFHRDGVSLGLPPFATEMRRRFWWHLVHVDFAISESLSARPSLDLFAGDTKTPLNIEDEDISSGMSTFPTERKGITPISICRLKCQQLDFLRQFSSPDSADVRWEVLTSCDMPTIEKSQLISKFEDDQEQRHLRYLDPSNSLHTLISIVIRTMICRMKIQIHSPRRHASNGTEISPEERDIIFTNATKVLEYASLIITTPGLEKYKWQMSSTFICHILLYVLIGVRHRKIGREVDRMWPMIGIFLSKYPQIVEEFNNTIFMALRKWILEAWDTHVAARHEAKLPDPETPKYIREMQSSNKVVETNHEMNRGEEVPQPTNVVDPWPSMVGGETSGGFEMFDSNDFSDILSFETDPNEWLRWDSLFREGTGFS